MNETKRKQFSLASDAVLNDELRYLSDITGKSRVTILHELIDSVVLCASSYKNFIYHINVHTPESITIEFFGKSAMNNGAFKVTSSEQVDEFERELVQKALENAKSTIKVPDLKVDKGTSFNHIAKKLGKNYRPNLVKVVN